MRDGRSNIGVSGGRVLVCSCTSMPECCTDGPGVAHLEIIARKSVGRGKVALGLVLLARRFVRRKGGVSCLCGLAWSPSARQHPTLPFSLPPEGDLRCRGRPQRKADCLHALPKVRTAAGRAVGGVCALRKPRGWRSSSRANRIAGRELPRCISEGTSSMHFRLTSYMACHRLLTGGTQLPSAQAIRRWATSTVRLPRPQHHAMLTASRPPTPSTQPLVPGTQGVPSDHRLQQFPPLIWHACYSLQYCLATPTTPSLCRCHVCRIPCSLCARLLWAALSTKRLHPKHMACLTWRFRLPLCHVTVIIPLLCTAVSAAPHCGRHRVRGRRAHTHRGGAVDGQACSAKDRQNTPPSGAFVDMVSVDSYCLVDCSRSESCEGTLMCGTGSIGMGAVCMAFKPSNACDAARP